MFSSTSAATQIISALDYTPKFGLEFYLFTTRILLIYENFQNTI